MTTLQIGVFDDFKEGRTLLLWSGDAAPFERLLAALGAAADTRRPLTLTDQDWAKGVRGARLQVSVREPGGVSEHPLEGGVAIDLQLSPDQLREFAGQVASLASPSGQAGHHYFDPPGAEIQIITSKGEYPPELRPEA